MAGDTALQLRCEFGVHAEKRRSNMPLHDWSKVDAAVFHDFHRSWVGEIARALNWGVLSAEYYAVVEKHNSQFGPIVLTLKPRLQRDCDEATVQVAMDRPDNRAVIAVRRVCDDRVVAMTEIVVPENKSSQASFCKFVDKALESLSLDIHLLVVDLMPPTQLDPNGIHGAIWEALTNEQFEAPPGKPLTLAAYEANTHVCAYIEPVAVGDALPEMPLFLEAGKFVFVALESTYKSAWEDVPTRWRTVIES
jgi:hypothetical protein